MNNERVQIKSNEMIEKQIGGDILCFEDIINEVMNVGKQFNQIKEFIYPFKLTTPEGLLMSRLRKPIGKDGHWGYRGEEINDYIEAMIWFFFVCLLDMICLIFIRKNTKNSINQGFRTTLLFLAIVFDIFLAIYSSFVLFICIKIGWMF